MSHAAAGNPLLILAAILLAGMSLGWLVQRIRLPGITGQILAGFLLGHSALPLFAGESVEGLQPLTHFALALIGVTVGAHMNLRRLRNAVRRLAFLLIAEAVVVPLLVLAVLAPLGAAPSLALLLGTLAISTAPATIVALVRETRSRGVFVKTLVGAVAINNVVCIVLFEIARMGAVATEGGVSNALFETALRLGLALALGAGAAAVVHSLTYRVVRPERLATISAISILLTFGLASYAAVSPLLACLALGAVQTNLNPARDRLVDSVFANFEPMILCVFFTLAGMSVSLEGVREAGLLAPAFVLARGLGKLLSAHLSMRLAGSTERVRRNLGLALIPQAGIAIGLVILVEEEPALAHVRDLFVAVVLVAVTVNEIIGPVMTRIALGRSGETGRDAPHLVDFLQEENIVTGLEAASLEAAIEQLTDLLISSHHLEGVDRDELLRSVLEREAQVSTCLGGGLAVPHGDLPEGLPMAGVMGISRRGLDFDTPDGRPVHCIVLLATPRGERDRHLAVLAALARTLGADSAVQQQLFSAKSPAHVCEILHGEETEDFGSFLETEGDS